MLLNSRKRNLLISVLVGVMIWFLPPPEGVDLNGWKLFAIFVGTIATVVLDALPMGAGTLLGLTVAVCTKTMPFKEAFSGYVSEVTWLVLIAFFIAHGFIQTGLGKRIAYWIVALVGKRTVGLAYGLSFADLLLAPAIPSVTARAGGVVFPIAQSLAYTFQSRAEDGTARRIGAYLIMVAFHGTVITSAMFLTAMAANPLAAKLAGQAGVQITWGNWALAALVPGLLSLAVMPWVIMWAYPPELKATPHAVEHARRELHAMGPMSRAEKLMAVGFVGLLALWIFGPLVKIDATTTALLGLAFLLVTDVLSWQDLLKQHNAWETFIWFGALIALADGLNKFGLAAWFGNWAAALLGGTHWGVAVLGLFLIYFYVHYFFASSTAHVGALYLPFLLVGIKLGAPPLMTALAFAFASNLFGGLTHYGCGPAPILYGAGFVSLKDWWRVGFIMSVVNIVIWLTAGVAWWAWLGY